MIRLDIRPTCTRYSNHHLRTILRLEPELFDLGITFVSDNADVQLIQCCSDIAHLVDRNIPTILQDLYLGPEIYWWGLREFMLRDNVKVVLKTSKFSRAESYDIQFKNDMQHVAVIAGDTTYGAYNTKISQAYHKIQVFANLIAWDHFQIDWPIPDFGAYRELDINIILGNIGHDYPVEETKAHRWEALCAVKKLTDLRSFIRTP